MKKLFLFSLNFIFNLAFSQFPTLEFLDEQNWRREINKSLEVGTIVGEFNVSPMGAAVYDIPIKVPSGTNGVEPNLSISYNSQSTNGILGFGWSLNGISSISRTPSNLYLDNIKREIKLTDYDNLSLDGKRLLLLSGQGTNMTNNAVYGFEVEDYSRIRVLNNSGSINNKGPKFFEYRKPDGTILTYGSENQFAKLNTSDDKIIIWRLDKVMDVYGNYCNYYYGNTKGVKFDGESYIDHIDYTMNDNISQLTSPNFRIQFEYSTFSGRNTYVNNHTIPNNLILKTIKIIDLTNNVVINRYVFNYFRNNTSYFNLHLGEIKFFSGTKELNSTVINWGDECDSRDYEIKTRAGIQEQNTLVGDFNGDGFSDVLKFNLTNHKLYLGSKNGLDEFISNGNFGGLKWCIAFDINRDGKDDWLRYFLDGNGNRVLETYSLSGNLFLNQSSSMTYPPPGTYSSNLGSSPIKASPGDLDGDGEPDVTHSVFLTSNSEVLFGPQFFAKPQIHGTIGLIGKCRNKLASINLEGLFHATDFHLTDFDGNGISEVFATSYINGQNKYGCVQFNPDIDDFEILFNESFSLPINTLHEKRKYFIDFNGDGKTDILVFNEFDKYWKLYISKGTIFEVRILDPNELPIISGLGKILLERYNNNVAEPSGNYFETCLDKNDIVFGDFNGDGMSDIGILRIKFDIATTLINYILETYYFDGTKFVNSQSNQLFSYYGVINYHINYYDKICENTPLIRTSDFNGDGITDVFYSTGGAISQADNLIYFNKGCLARYVTKITNGYNNSINIAYNTLSNSRVDIPNVYEKTTVSIDNPLMKIQPPMSVVAFSTNPNGIGGETVTSYYYYDLITHPLGRGLLGFRESRMKAPNGWVHRSINFWNATNFFLNYKTENITYENNDINSNVLVDQDRNNVSEVLYTSISGKFKKLEKVSDIYFDNYTKVETKTNYTYFPSNIFNGQLKSRITTYTDKLNGQDYYKNIYEIEQYQAVGPLFLLLKEKRIKEVNDLNNGNQSVRWKEFEYDNKGALVLSVDYPDDSKYRIETALEYNQLGTINRKITEAVYSTSFPKIISTKYLYDNRHRFVEKTIDEQFHTSMAPLTVYDNVSGNIRFAYDVTGNLISQNSYDDFNRLTQSIDQFGNTKSISYLWSDKEEFLYYIKTAGLGMPTTKRYYDQLGRNVYSETEGFNGLIIESKEYNQSGLVSKEFTPRYINEQEEYIEYSYDSRNRLQSSISSCGQTNMVNYYPRKTEKTDPLGRVSFEEYNVLGKVIKVKDIGGNEIITTYLPDGNPEFTSSFGITTSFKYNMQGRRIEIDEPNSGKTLTEYSELGLVLKTIDNKGNRIEYMYNPDQTVSSKKIWHLSKNNGSGPPILSASEELTYIYESDPNNSDFGLIKQVSSSKNTSKTFTYYPNRQINVISEQINGINFNTSYTYYADGKLKNTVFPNNFIVQNQYDNKGYFNKVVDLTNNQTIYSLNSIDGQGRERSFAFGENPDFSQPADNSGLLSSCGVICHNSYGNCNNFLGIRTEKIKTFPGLSQLYTSVIYDLAYNIDQSSLNIIRRDDVLKGKSEIFTYDSQDRLIEVKNQFNVVTMSHSYFDNGNIQHKSDLGQYAYNFNDHPHAVSKIIGVCDLASLCNGSQSIQYNGYNKASSIMQGKWQMNLNYSIDENRNFWELYQYSSNLDVSADNEGNNRYNPNPIGSDVTWGDLNTSSGTGLLKKQKYYSGLYDEIETIGGGTKAYSYINGPFGIFAVNISDAGAVITPTANTSETFMIQKDYLGSFMGLIDMCGNIREEYSYDAWGRRRNPYNWSYDNVLWKPSNVDPVTGEWNEPIEGGTQEGPQPTTEDFYCFPNYNFMIDRGYIGQEHHDLFGIVNLNARLYDPILGRMLSPDALVSDPTNAQNFNRYSYANNNPLRYSDPDGNLPFMAAALISIGIYTASTSISYAADNNPEKRWNWSNFANGLVLSFIQGGATNAVGGYFDGLKTSTWAVKELGRASAHGAMGSFFSAASGGDPIMGFVTSFTGSFSGSGVLKATVRSSEFERAVALIGTSSITSGAMEAIQGGNFGEGFARGLTISLVNHFTSLMTNDGGGGESKKYTFKTRKELESGNKTRGVSKQNGYQLVDGMGQILNVGGVVYGGTEMGLLALRQNNGAQLIGRTLGFGTQRTAHALSGTVGVVSKVGRGVGGVGYVLQFSSTGSKFVTGQTISLAEGVNFGISTVFMGAAWFTAGTLAAPFVAGGSLIYGAGQLGSYMITGKTLEENYFGK